MSHTHAGLAVNTLWLALVAPLLTGCGASSPSPSTSIPPVTSLPGEIPTDAECQQFATDLIQAFSTNDAPAAAKLIHWPALLDKVTAGIEVPAATRQGFIKGVIKKSESGEGWCAAISPQIVGGGSYTFLRVRENSEGKRVLMRLLTPEGAMNYHDYVVEKRNGQTVATDIHVATTGELFSETLRRSYLQLAAEASRGVVDKWLGKDNELIQNLPKMQTMSSAMRAGRSAEVIATYRSLPESVQKEKVFMLAYLMAAAHEDNDTYLAAIDTYRQTFPNDICADLSALDAFFLRKEYNRGYECLDRLQAALGGDPALEWMRGNFQINEGELAAAKVTFEKVIRDEPTFANAHWGLVTVSLLEKNFDETVLHLDSICERFQFSPNDLTNNAEYAEFRKSPQYAAWLKRNAAVPEF